MTADQGSSAAGPPSSDLARLGRSLRARGDIAGAEASFRRAIGLHRQRFGSRHPGMAPLHDGLANALLARAAYAEAQVEAATALSIRREAGGTDRLALAVPLTYLGAAAQGQGDHAAACTWLEQALGLRRQVLPPTHPDLALTLLALAAARRGRGDLAGAEACLEELLTTDPDHFEARCALIALFCEQERWSELRQAASLLLPRRNVFSHPRPGAAWTLLLVQAVIGNLPLRHLLGSERFGRIEWLIEYAPPGQHRRLPPHDVAFNAVGDPDEGREALLRALAFAVQTPDHRLLNHPARVLATRRDLASALFAGIDGLVVPTTVRLPVGGLGDDAVLDRHGLRLPVLLRQPGSHGGREALRIDTAMQLAAARDALDPDAEVYLTNLHDVRSADGFHRKYRIVFVDREPYPYHLAISPHWLVHYRSAEMQGHAWKLAEERRFLRSPEQALGLPAMEALRRMAAALDLDYCGADLARLDDGRLLLFEANATMLVHPETNETLAYKNPYVDRIVTGFRTMLERAVSLQPGARH